MSIDPDTLRMIAHRLASQSATLELETFVLDTLGDEASRTSDNLRRVASTIRDLSAKLEEISS